MTMDMHRRAFMAAAALGMASIPRQAQAQAKPLMVVQWGAAWIDVSRKIVDAYTKDTGQRVAWELHAGGAMAIVAKVKPNWPNVPYQMISGWDPSFRAMMAEEWLEPVSPDDMPHLKDIPEIFFQKDDAGRLMTVPLSTAGAFWGYRTDLVDKPIESIEQLLEPRFKGKLCVPYPVNLSGLFIVTLAVQRGGDEKNLEPGWAFLKELAEKGQIGRVINNNSEFVNAMSAGDVSVAFFNNGGWALTRSRFPVRMLSRLKDNKGFLYNEGFAILKSDNVAAAKKLANHFAGPEVNEQYNAPLGSGPTNARSRRNPALTDTFYEPGELAQYAYIADFAYLSANVNAIAKRWETEIAPLIRS